MPMRFADVVKLLGNKLPGDEKELEYLARLTADLVEEKGEAWVRENRVLLLAQWQKILDLGV